MSDRKYRQRGYQDEPRSSGGAKPERPREPVPREMRVPNMPGFQQVARCQRCGNRLTPGEVAHDARCPRCGIDLHSCIQCVHFDTSRRFECAEAVPARIAPKDERNTCELFQLRVTVERETGSTPTTSARQAFDDLFK